ncbi:unnamed protein product (macronuclear) [Paramecium tetraurelia]|uniref:Uncharacterized protein n=1 Tax=Paramecium tetraurelia TaxID=5888 RepID=A0DPE3_PARTE|nr:uncharacterized protein GSPATT00019092001 [Paramecium tetraurelia]CAK84910.1 unnamed protein product [Paramecium tetraurelia]|eukprot:XP_001452307.1 hypothetical protein (macronuclear) [Paramecium tetraurelia strain d4-2]
MHKFDTIQGKLFYTVYMMHQQRQIDTKQKGKLKGMEVCVCRIIDLIIQKHPSLNKIETDNTVIARRSLLDLADTEENEQDCQKVEKKRPIAIRPILTNSKFKSSRSLMSSPQRK